MGERVLVVDDDPWILRMVTATLEKKKYVVDTAREGRQALERAQAKTPDVIITDIMMPVMDGWTFIQHLRQDPKLAGVPVIFLTALSRDEARLSQMGLTPDDYLAKPFRFDDLEKRVSKAIARGPASVSGVYPQTEDPNDFESGVYPVDSGVHSVSDEFHTPDRISFTPLPGYVEPDDDSTVAVPPLPESRSAPRPRNEGSGAAALPGGAAPVPGYPAAGSGYPPGYGAYGQPPGYPGYPAPGYPSYPGAGYHGYPPGYPAPGGYPPGYPAPGGYPGYPPQGVPPGGPPPDASGQPTAPAAPGADAQEDKPEPKKRHSSGHLPRRSTALNGRLEQLGLSSLLVMMEMERKDGVLTLRESKNEKGIGRIFLRRGQVVCARLDNAADFDGKQCVYEMLCWKKGTFSFNAMEVDMEDTVKSSTTHLLMEGARLIDEANRDA